VNTVREAMTMLRRRGAIRLVPDLVEAIAGGPVNGSWWAHPSGGVIYRVASQLEERDDVVVSKLAGGKVTFVHARYFPALARVVTDPGWRRKRMSSLDREGRKALAAVERKGRLVADPISKKALEKSALVRVFSEHTESGKHVTVLEAWSAWVARKNVSARNLSLDEALTSLASVGIDLR
jgi:hypothetical protein